MGRSSCDNDDGGEARKVAQPQDQSLLNQSSFRHTVSSNQREAETAG